MAECCNLLLSNQTCESSEISMERTASWSKTERCRHCGHTEKGKAFHIICSVCNRKAQSSKFECTSIEVFLVTVSDFTLADA